MKLDKKNKVTTIKIPNGTSKEDAALMDNAAFEDTTEMTEIKVEVPETPVNIEDEEQEEVDINVTLENYVSHVTSITMSKSGTAFHVFQTTLPFIDVLYICTKYHVIIVVVLFTNHLRSFSTN